MRNVVVAVILLFAWRGHIDKLVHPTDVPKVVDVVVDPTAKAWVDGVKVDGILPADRDYYARYFDALGWILVKDGERDSSMLDTNEKLRRFNAGSLDAAIEKASVGKYPGLGESLDRAFALACAGADPAVLSDPDALAKAITDGQTPRPMTKAMRERFLAVCQALVWKLTINKG